MMVPAASQDLHRICQNMQNAYLNKCFLNKLLYIHVRLYIMYPSSPPLSLSISLKCSSSGIMPHQEEWRIRRSSPLLLHCCLIRALRDYIISERITRGRKLGWNLAENASVCLCIYMIKRQNGGGMAAFSSPIASRQALRHSQSQLRRELVSMEMTLEWCWCLLIAEEAARWAMGQAHTSGHTHTYTHYADLTVQR